MVDLKKRIMRNLGDMQSWGANAKVLMITNLFWVIPFPWFFFYQAIFMRNLGMDEVFIGFSVMLPLVLQLFLPMVGGHLADRFGRKFVYLLFDGVWIGVMITWFMARESWHIVVAMLLQGLPAASSGIWDTLLVEDTELPYRVGIYSFFQLSVTFGGLFTPVAGALISLYGIDQGCRYMFLIVLMCITIAFVFRWVYLRETEIGRTLISVEKNGSARPSSYGETSRMVVEHKRLLVSFVLTIIGAMVLPLVNTYKPLYLSDSRALALDESIISVIPMASSIPSLIALLLVTPRLKPTHIRKAVLTGYVCGMMGFMVLIIAPKGALALAVVSSILDSARTIATFSILRVFLANAIDEANPLARAKIMSLTVTCSALASWPAPVIGGYLYTANPIWPFVLTTVLLAASLLLMFEAGS